MPISLKIDTTNSDAPDTRLTKENIEHYISELEDEDNRDVIQTVFQKVSSAQINPYQLHEMEELTKILHNSKYKLREIVSTFQGILMRLKPSVKHGGRRSLKKKTRRHRRRNTKSRRS